MVEDRLFLNKEQKKPSFTKNEGKKREREFFFSIRRKFVHGHIFSYKKVHFIRSNKKLGLK